MREILRANYSFCTWYRNPLLCCKPVGIAPFLVLFSCLLVNACTLLAQPGQAKLFVAWVKHYGPENGLAHREVNAIFQDRQGFMWFGTKFGLSRFDGTTFTTFNKARNGLEFDDIHSIAQDGNGMLWLMGSPNETRITVFDPLTGKGGPLSGLLDTKALNNPGGILSQDKSTIFFANNNPVRLVSYTPETGLHSVSLPRFTSLGCFRATAQQTVWCIVGNRQLVELTPDGRIVHQFTHQQGDVISWHFGQRNAGIEFFYSVHNPAKGGKRLFYSVDERGCRQQWPSALIDAMSRYTGAVCYPLNSSGLLWDGITLRDSTNQTLLTITDQTSGETIENRSFYRDRDGSLWLGTSFGVYQVKLTPDHFQRLFYQPGTKGNPAAAVRGITVQDDQVFANLEKSGLYTISRHGGRPKKLLGNRLFVYGLAPDNQQKLLVGDVDQIIRYNLSSTRANTIPMPLHSEAWSFYPLGADQWLVGTQNGLRLVDMRKHQTTLFTRYNQFAELAQAHVLHIAPDPQGNVWICSGTGFYRFDPVKGITARYWSGGKGRFYLPADNFQHFYSDKAGLFWLATGNAGLIRWKPASHQYRQFRRTEGLSNDNIYAVYADTLGYLWLSSDYGIMQFDLHQLTTRTYFVQDGITHNEFNRISHAQDSAGRIYFGGLNGITTFNPADFVATPVQPPLTIRLVSFRQFDQTSNQLIDKTATIAGENRLVIRPGEQSAILDFALLNFTDGEKNVYAYRFEGLDNVWTTQTESSLRLGNLPYGSYRLLIKGQAANGQWSANRLDFQVDVLRPFYLQFWFLTAVAVSIIAGIWGWLRWRIWNHRQEELRLQTEIRQATSRIAADKEVIEQQAKTLVQLNETRSRFFANISHEFRTPLTVILGMADTIKHTVSGEQTALIRHNSQLIERQGHNLLRLINQILDLSRLEAGEMHLQPIQTDLVRFTRYVAESFQAIAVLKGVQLHFKADIDTLETDFDQDKLQDILSNLVTNAIKFTPPGGRVTLHLKLSDSGYDLNKQGYYEAVSPAWQRTGTWIYIQVQDTGSGISSGDLPLIFNRFFQTNSALLLHSEGTGIGLSLVRELIVLMQGGLAVRSIPDQGSLFVVSLPLTRQAPLGSLAAPPDPANVSFMPVLAEPISEQEIEKATLLLVEDNEDVAGYIMSCLPADFHILRAEDGQAGIDLAIEHIPDLILSDVMMPRKDGFDLCDTVKNDERTSHIPVVLLTARAAVSDRIAGLRRGADAYLVKPFERDELVVVLNNLLQTRRTWQRYYGQLALGRTASVEDSPAPATEPIEDRFLLRLQREAEAQLDQASLSIEVLCDQLGMSRSTLHRKMIALTGMPISRYLRTLQIRKAQALLATTTLSVSEVAYAVGFDDPKYFSRVFSDETGVSPAKYRHSD